LAVAAGTSRASARNLGRPFGLGVLGSARDGPELVGELYELAASCHTAELLRQQTALAPPAEAKFSDQLLVPSLAARRLPNAVQNLPITACVGSLRHFL
jgi:hypothetical protein